MYACLYRPPDHDHDDHRGARFVQEEISACSACSAVIVADADLVAIAREFSPRYESRRDGLSAVTIDVRGLDRLLGNAQAIGEELRSEAARRGVRVHVALAATCTAALVLAIARPGLTIVASDENDEGDEDARLQALAPLPIGILEKLTDDHECDDQPGARRETGAPKDSAISAISVFRRWGLRTLGELAALPPAELSSRLGQPGLLCRAAARGEDSRPLVPDAPEERFESSLDLEWPIEGLEPMSFVLTRLLEPLSIRLERRDRGVAVLHLRLGLVGGGLHARSLQLPAPMRDVRTLRTLALLDLESHPPSAAVERVAIVVDPTPGRVMQHTLFAPSQPTPEQLSTLLARLGAVMGQDRIGSPATVDSYRPGAFEMKAFVPPEHDDQRRARGARREKSVQDESSACSALNVVRLRRCRHPVPARVAADAQQRPVRVTTDRRGFAGGAVVHASGPWRTSGEWWNLGAGKAGEAGGPGEAGRPGEAGGGNAKPFQASSSQPGWDRDEWDVTLNDGASYRVFMDRRTGSWFIDAICD
jgi:protein ImuB